MTAKLILCNDAGEETIIEQDLGVEKSLNNMNSIENFVLSLKTAMMPKLEQKLLEKSQLSDTQLALIKKKNGFRQVEVSSLNGVYSLPNQQYILLNGEQTNHFCLLGGLDSTYKSDGLCGFIEEWVMDLSYTKVSRLLTQHTGTCIFSGGGIKKYLLRKSLFVSNKWASNSHKKENKTLQIVVNESINIYDTEQGEVILMMDDVGVKAQKPHKKIDRIKEDAKRIDTTVVLISMEKVVGKKAEQTDKPTVPLAHSEKNGAMSILKEGKTDKKGVEKDTIPFRALTEGIDATGKVIYPIEKAISDTVKELYGDKPEQPLPVVAITDGARSIRITLQLIFGINLFIILDWYHLQLKIKNLMSMIAPNKTVKELYINDLKTLLWHGKTTEALDYLAQIPTVKNQEKFEELVGYLTKHQTEIIDYDKRKKAGKTIGSGRCEKANDGIVAHRQKKKGMAWSRSGSKALAIIKTCQLNKAA